MIGPVGAAQTERLARLAATHKAAFAPESRGWSADEIADLAARGLLIAHDDDASLALFSLVADEAELLTLAVRPEQRRRGRAAALLSAALPLLSERGARSLFLEVAADNTPARALYEATGFQSTSIRKNYYRQNRAQPVDAIVMTLTL